MAPGAANPPVAARGAAAEHRRLHPPHAVEEQAVRDSPKLGVTDVQVEDVVGGEGGGEVAQGLVVPPVHHGHQGEEEEAGHQLGAQGPRGLKEGGQGAGHQPYQCHVARHRALRLFI